MATAMQSLHLALGRRHRGQLEARKARRGKARHTLRIRRVISIKCCRSRDDDDDVAKVANMKSNMRYADGATK